MRYSLSTALVLAALPLAAHAAAVDMAGVSKCDLKGFSVEPDPKGTNVRSAPSVNAPIIGHLPPRHYEREADLTIGAEFDVLGSKDGWILIENAEDGKIGEESTFRFKGPGWIFGGAVGFDLGSPLRAGPSADAKIAANLEDGDHAIGWDTYVVRRTHACTGHFADLTVQLPPAIKKNATPLRGWASHLCQGQLTTCDPG